MSSPFLARLRDERAELRATMDATLEAAAAEERDLTEAEDRNLNDAVERMNALDERIQHLSEVEIRNAAAAELAAKVDAASDTENRGIVRVGDEPVTYHERSEHGFFADLAAARQGDEQAKARLVRHRQEMAVEIRAADTVSDIQDFVPPKYLLDKFADVAVSGRPVANLISNQGAPTAEIFRVPRFTAGASVAWQSTENTALQTYNRDTDYVQLNTDTIGAFYDASVQSLDFSPATRDQQIFRQMASVLDAAIEEAVLARNETGWHGLVNVDGKHSVTYTDADPDLAGLYTKIGEADTAIAADRKQPGQVVVMSHKMFNWALTEVDSTGRPIIAPVAASNAPGSWANRSAEGFAGFLFNYPVVRSAVPLVDEATPTKEQLILFRPDDCLLYESAPSFRVFEDSGSSTLTVRFRVHKHVAFSAEIYPTSVAVISGTGTVVSFG